MASRRDWKPNFLAKLAETGNVTLAAVEAAVGRQTVYDAKEADSEFAVAWADAEDVAADLLEEEIRRRGMDGWDEPVFHKGEQVATVRKYSDQLLMFLMRARRPERFRENHRHEIGGEATLQFVLSPGEQHGHPDGE